MSRVKYEEYFKNKTNILNDNTPTFVLLEQKRKIIENLKTPYLPGEQLDFENKKFYKDKTLEEQRKRLKELYDYAKKSSLINKKRIDALTDSSSNEMEIENEVSEKIEKKLKNNKLTR